MQTAYFPMRYLRITQAYGKNTYSHKYGYPIDNGGKDLGKDGAWAPFDGVIKKIWANGNSVWLESSNKVLYADGTKDFMTVMFTHDDDVSNLKVGQKIKQWVTFYQEGQKNADGNHVHIEVTKGKFTGTGWYQAPNGQWVTNNPYRPERAFTLKDITILNGGGLKWVTYTEPKPPVKTKNTFLQKETLKANQSIWSNNKKYQAIFQKDGNFVIYKHANGKKPIWASNTDKKGGTYLTLQTDGNVVIYVKRAKPVWATNTNGKGGWRLVMQDDGNLVLYAKINTPVWASNTNGK